MTPKLYDPQLGPGEKNRPVVWLFRIFLVVLFLFLVLLASARAPAPTNDTMPAPNILVIDTVGQAFLAQTFDISIVENENLKVQWASMTMTLFEPTWSTSTHLSIFPRDEIAAWGAITPCGNNTAGKKFTQKLTYLSAEWYGTEMDEKPNVLFGEKKASSFLIGEYTVLFGAKLITPPTHDFPQGDYCFDKLYLRTDIITTSNQ